jgi:hypothetical protein
VEHSYRNIGFVLMAIPLLMVAGFWIPYIGAFPRFDPAITVAVHIHAALLFTWIALLVIQPLAIRYRAFALHRSLGTASLALMPLIVFFAAAMIRKEYRESIGAGASRLAALRGEYLSIAQLCLLTACFMLAIHHIRKRNVPAHMRYMICIALILLPAGLARTLGYWFDRSQAISQTVSLSVIDASLIALIAYDRPRKLPSKPYYLVLASYVIIEAAWLGLGRPV